MNDNTCRTIRESFAELTGLQEITRDLLSVRGKMRLMAYFAAALVLSPVNTS